MNPDEGILDPWVEQFMKDYPGMFPKMNFSPEWLAVARPDNPVFPGKPVAKFRKDTITAEAGHDIPVWIYEHETAPTGLVVYFHGGGYCTGSPGLMDNVAREIAVASGAAVISVGYRLAPEHPFPAGFDDCVTVTRWALAHAAPFGTTPDQVAVAGESAGGNLSAAVALRMRGEPGPRLAAQLLIYPALDIPGADYPSRQQFSGGVALDDYSKMVEVYGGGRDITSEVYAFPMLADSLVGLPPALVVLGGCDLLRDEGRAYGQRLAADGVPTEEYCAPGQPHPWINMGFPAAEAAWAAIGPWLKARFAERPAA